MHTKMATAPKTNANLWGRTGLGWPVPDHQHPGGLPVTSPSCQPTWVVTPPHLWQKPPTARHPLALNAQIMHNLDMWPLRKRRLCRGRRIACGTKQRFQIMSKLLTDKLDGRPVGWPRDDEWLSERFAGGRRCVGVPLSALAPPGAGRWELAPNRHQFVDGFAFWQPTKTPSPPPASPWTNSTNFTLAKIAA